MLSCICVIVCLVLGAIAGLKLFQTYMLQQKYRLGHQVLLLLTNIEGGQSTAAALRTLVDAMLKTTNKLMYRSFLADHERIVKSPAFLQKVKNPAVIRPVVVVPGFMGERYTEKNDSSIQQQPSCALGPPEALCEVPLQTKYELVHAMLLLINTGRQHAGMLQAAILGSYTEDQINATIKEHAIITAEVNQALGTELNAFTAL